MRKRIIPTHTHLSLRYTFIRGPPQGTCCSLHVAATRDCDPSLTMTTVPPYVCISPHLPTYIYCFGERTTATVLAHPRSPARIHEARGRASPGRCTCVYEADGGEKRARREESATVCAFIVRGRRHGRSGTQTPPRSRLARITPAPTRTNDTTSPLASALSCQPPFACAPIL